MNTEATKLWNLLSSSLRPEQVLSLLRLGLEPDDDNDMASNLEAWSGAAINLDELAAPPTAISFALCHLSGTKTLGQEASNPVSTGVR